MDADYFTELIKTLKEKDFSKDEIARLKVTLCGKHHIKKVPTDIEVLLTATNEDFSILKNKLMTKPTRTISGVSVIAIMSHPFKCPHGKCIMCPGGPDSSFGDVPQSYTGREPATMRGKRNNYDPYLQVMNRLEQYIATGHSPDKAELIIMGGTFPSFEKEYKTEFIRNAFKAMTDFSDLFYIKKKNKFELNLEEFKKFFELPGDIKDNERSDRIRKKLLKIKEKNKESLEEAQKKNETSKIRCVGLTVETRPDYATSELANEALEFGVTKIELGVQTIYDEVLNDINRGHSVQESIDATKRLKDLGFKINYHMMPGLPGVSREKDLDSFRQLFEDPDFKPDMLKIYPCMVMKGTKLYERFEKGEYKPLSTAQAAELIAEVKSFVPEYVRIMRVQRDIPTSEIDAGVNKTNLRQYISEILKSRNTKCNCIRCREIGRADQDRIDPRSIAITCKEYEASGGREFFICIDETKLNAVIGFCRMRFPGACLRPEITESTAIIRELHVYGEAASIGGKATTQHIGYGKQLLAEAEEIAKRRKKNKIVIISAVGAREYYRKLGYEREGPYMVKKL